MMIGFLPPISNCVRQLVAAACSIESPTRYDPVKVIAFIASLLTSSAPTTDAEPVNTFNTPAGSPASVSSSPNLTPSTGVSEAGLKTTALTAASAGAILRAGIANGKFHGVITETTPTGSRNV